jgi:hypothetical protein
MKMHAKKQVVQFLYGEDGMDGVWVEKQRYDILGLSRPQVFINKYSYIFIYTYTCIHNVIVASCMYY